ncbi:MAG: enoyl-CoA hydratase, partial [Bacteroidetes bacterium]
MYNTLLTDLSGDIFQITINRPDKLNALNGEVIEELERAVSEMIGNAKAKSAIITGTGTRAFVAGADISGFAGLSKSEGKEL